MQTLSSNLVVASFLLTLAYPVLAQIVGTKETCDVEGEPITLTAPHVKCFNCTCRSGEVQCVRNKCPAIDDCHVLEDTIGADECCRQCKGCRGNDAYHVSGTVWTESCERFTCLAGVITRSAIQCYAPCDDPTPPRIGECCPTCSCNSTVDVRSNPCVSCECQLGILVCTKASCPVLNCPPSSVVYDFEQCCPRCRGSAKLTVPPRGACLLGSVVYPSGKTFTLDECTSCSCDNSTLTCERVNCPILRCDEAEQTIGAGECCAVCVDKSAKAEAGGRCVYSNKTYEDGETWNTPSCETCVCERGRVSCSPIMCPAVNCPANSTLQVSRGQCCPSCLENEGVCTVYGGSHFRTFDDKLYAFVGSCKYQLAGSCASNSFNIRVKFLTSGNDAKIKRIFMRASDARVDVQYNRIVRVDDRVVKLPYTADELEISETRDSVQLVGTRIGVRIKWRYEGFLEVAVPRSYSNSVCGLCGNFNSVGEDDLTTREGILVESPAIFAQSWTVGDENCFDTREYEVRACDTQRDQRLCNYIRGAVFRKCLQRINVTSYYEACLKDVCQCSSDQKCHCESFDNYVRDCRKLGITLPRWRKSVGC